MGFDPRDPNAPLFSRSLTRRQLLTGTGGLVLARFTLLDSATALAQATPVVPASPTIGTGAPEVPINLAMTAPIPMDDLKNYAYTGQSIRTPDSFYDFPAYIAQSFPADISAAIGALNPEFCVSTSLTTPVTQDYSKITRMLDALTIVPPSGSAPNWDSLFAAVKGAAAAPSQIGERNVVWTSDSAFTEVSPPKPIKAVSILFTRGRYAVLINVRDIANPASPAEIAAIAKTIDDRIVAALALQITPAARMVMPLIDFGKMLRQPPGGTNLPSIGSMGLTFRAIDGQLLRGAFESDAAFALLQSGDKNAVAQGNGITYKAALDQKASIMIANISVPTARGRDAIFSAFFPDLAKQVDYRGSNVSLVVEQYSFPEGANLNPVWAMLDDRRKNDLDHVYKPIAIPSKSGARATGTPAQFGYSETEVDIRVKTEAFVAELTAAKSSAEVQAIYDHYTDLLNENLLPPPRINNESPAGEPREMVFRPSAQPTVEPFASGPTFNRIQLLTMAVTPSQYAPRQSITLDTLTGDQTSDLRSAIVSISGQFLTGRSFGIGAPAPKTAPPPLPAMADLSKTPFVGFAGLAPTPQGKLSKYVYDWTHLPSGVVLPLDDDQWSNKAVLFQPSPVADVVYNLPISLAHVSLLALSTPAGSNGQLTRHINTQIYVDPATAAASWSAISGAVAKPQKSPSTLGEASVAWTDSGDRDPSLSSPFKSAAIFFARGSFGVVIEIRDFSGKAPTLKEVAALASPIDKGIAAAIAGSPPESARLGFPTFGPGGISYLARFQQVRCVGGALIANASEQGDANALKTAKAAYKTPLAAKATVLRSEESIPLATGRRLFTVSSSAAAPLGLTITFAAELTVPQKSADAAKFGLANRLKERFPGAEISAVTTSGSTSLATVTTTDSSGKVTTLAAQDALGDRIADVELRVTANDRSAVSAAALSANQALAASAASLVDQILKGSGYAFAN